MTVRPDAAALAGLLADDERRRVVAAMVLGASTVPEIRHATGLDARGVMVALGRLCDGELVVDGADGTFVLLGAAFAAAARAAAPLRTEDPVAEGSPEAAARVLRAFVRDGQLTSIPAQHAKRLVVLDLIVQGFDIGRRYPEREVNALLERWHDDYAALRRYLVDDGFLERGDGWYWRAGGTVEI